MLVYAIASQESGCNPNINDGGILQVDDACLYKKKCGTVDKQIYYGIQELKEKYEAILKSGVSPGDAVQLMLFAYNRGVGALDKAVKRRLAGEEIHSAMFNGCMDVYPISVSGVCGHGGDTKRCCDDPGGYGAGYPAKILKLLDENCKAAGGSVKDMPAGAGLLSIAGDPKEAERLEKLIQDIGKPIVTSWEFEFQDEKGERRKMFFRIDADSSVALSPEEQAMRKTRNFIQENLPGVPTLAPTPPPAGAPAPTPTSTPDEITYILSVFDMKQCQTSSGHKARTIVQVSRECAVEFTLLEYTPKKDYMGMWSCPTV
jgi:hypothetical protein